MSPVLVGIIGICFLFILFILRMPVAFSMAFVGTLGVCFLVGTNAGFSLLARDVFDGLGYYSFSVIPMFILTGCFAFAAGITKRIYATAYTLMGQLRGGLAVATTVACAGFGAICGSAAATAATVGKVALPEMKEYNYSDTLATGTVASAGTIGILIPPSTVFIIYGILTEQSIGKLFAAGVLPGILLTLLFVATIAVICSRDSTLGPSGLPTSWKEKIASLGGVVETLLLFTLAIGGLFAGWFTPTQSGGVAAAGALLIGVVRRELTWQSFIRACKDALHTSCMVLFIITGAMIFGHFIAVTTIAQVLVNWVGALTLPTTAILVIVLGIFFVGGLFIDSMALIVLLVPIFYPVVVTLNIDPIWFGVLIVLLSSIGLVTPPVGVNVYVVGGIAENVPLGRIFKGVMPFLIAMVVCLALLVAFPCISTFLPSLVSY